MAIIVGTTTKDYISSINFLDKRDILEEVLDVTGEDATILDIMELTGRFKVTDVPAYDHFENNYLYEAAVISSIDGTANGEDSGATNENIQFVISADDALPVVNELAMFENKRIGIVKTVTSSTRTVVVAPLGDADGDTLSPSSALVAAAQTVIFFSNASAEGSDDPDGRRPRFTRSQNQIQIFKTSAKVTDLQKVSAIEVKYNGKNYIMYKLQHDTLQKHRSDIAFASLVGHKASFADPNSGDDVYTTQGLRKYILGGDGTVNTSGGVDVPLSAAITQANLRTMNRALDKRGAGKESWFWVGGDLRADLDEVLLTLEGVKNGVVYNSFGIGNGSNRALDLGVDSVKIYGRTHHIKSLAAYDHPEVFGATGFNFGSEGYLIPTGKIKADKSGNMMDRLCMRYMSGDGTDMKHLETLTGKLAPVPTSTESALTVSYQSIMGLQALGIRQFGIFSKA
jgi:hypothetical protein